MAIKKILFDPDSLLHVSTDTVNIVNDEIQEIITNLVDTLYSTSGVGLSAPQIGINKRVCIYDAFRKKREQSRNYKVLINPKIVHFEKPKRSGHEGCKSLPTLFLNIPRYTKIRVKGIDQTGQLIEFEAKGLQARVIQHEIDHLDGKLIFESTQLNDENRQRFSWYTTNLNSIRMRLSIFDNSPDGLLYQEKSNLNNIYVFKDRDQIQLYFSDKAGNQKLSGIMSRVDIKNPLMLLGLYTQVMMLSLAWNDNPQNIYVIGFGGGRMPMIFYHYFPNSIIESTEIDPSVVDISQKYFGVVLDERMKVHIKDGRMFLSETNNNYDIILIDTYNGSGAHPFPFATKEFYELCKSHIRSEGVVVTNLVETDFLFKEKVNTFIQSFDTVFDYMTDGVHVLFGSNSKQIDLKNFLRRARKLDKDYCFAFPFFFNAKKVKEVKFGGKVSEEHSTTTMVTDSIIPQKQSLIMNSKVGRNDLCPCRSGKKYKKCHLLIK